MDSVARQVAADASAASGYLHPTYAGSHAMFGVPRVLPRCGGWIIERTIPGFGDTDAMGCYPIFACRDWSGLHLDIEELGSGLVSLALVTDPFGDYDEAYLRRCFPDVVIPFKEHYVIDLTKPRNQVISKHHRYEARKAFRDVRVEVVPDPPSFLDEWMRLHAHLVRKHRIEGVAAFSREAFAEQLATPGVVAMVAIHGGENVAAMLHTTHGNAAYAHILGCTGVGYEHGALYALIYAAIEHFSDSVGWLDIMGVPGRRDAGAAGIRQFKRGWTRETRTAWLCGVVLDRPRYERIVRATGTAGVAYFPAYRDGEMA